MIFGLRHIIRRFRTDERGANAVEFAILMPIMMVCFGAIVEGARIYWNYQGAVSGVRDAARYLARTTDADICDGLGLAEALPGHNLVGNAVARDRIEANMGTGESNLFPLGVSLTGLNTRLLCQAKPSPSTDLVPVAVVRAQVTIELPFGAVFEFFGARQNAIMSSTIIDQSRIYGL